MVITDLETGKPAFELRLYDPRINRCLTTDSAGQYSSPYLAMGNNWVNKIDPDGGEDWYINNETGELEWHNTSGSIDGLTWVGTNSASHDYLSSIGKLFGGSGKISFSDIASRAYYDITNGFNSGLEQRGKDFVSFMEDPVGRTLQGTANAINAGGAFLNDFVASGEQNLGFFAMSSAYDIASNMTLYDWSYAVGYSAPDIALGFVGGYALSTVRIGGLTGKAIFQSSTLGYKSKLFGRWHPKFYPDGVKGSLNKGPFRTGWGFKKGRGDVFRTSLPNGKHIDWFHRW